ncbi:MAG TPA: hypothetical protein VER03_21545 [Bryobacteraceae bacterium]|nr:hypothetical protein [Bryobacteraceae bacterium]
MNLSQEAFRALRAELVLLDFDGGSALFQAGDSPAGNQFQLAFVIQLGWPANRKFQSFPGHKYLIGGEEDASAADVDRLARTFFWATPFV